MTSAPDLTPTFRHNAVSPLERGLEVIVYIHSGLLLSL